MYILFDNKLKTATLSAVDADANFPVTNLQSPFLKKRFQSTESKDVVTVNLSEAVTINSFFNDYTNAEVVVWLMYGGFIVRQLSGSMAYQFDDTLIDQIVVNLDVDGEKVVNGNFIDGSTGWTLGTGARVRQQGWVAKLGSLDTFVASPLQSFPASPGQSGSISTAVNFADLVATNVQVYIRWADSGNVNLGSSPIASYTSADVGWTVKSASIVAPANTAWANIQLQVNGYVSGDCYIGFAYGTVNGVPITTNWDFADGDTGWTSVGIGAITYDPTNAYMGNALPGGSGKTLVLNYNTGSYSNGSTFSTPTGSQYEFVIKAKCISGANPLTSRIRYNNEASESDSITITSAEASDWVERKITATANSPLAVSAYVDFLDNWNDGLWLVGKVSVSRIVSTPAYLGGIGFGQAHQIDPPESFWDEAFQDNSIVSESDGGQVLQEFTEPLRIYDFRIPTLTRDEARDCQDIYRQCGRGATLWLDPDTDDLPPMYCQLADAPVVSKSKRQYSMRISFKEAR